MTEAPGKKRKAVAETPKPVQMEDLVNLINALEVRLDKKFSVVEDKISKQSTEIQTTLKSELLESLKETCIEYVEKQYQFIHDRSYTSSTTSVNTIVKAPVIERERALQLIELTVSKKNIDHAIDYIMPEMKNVRLHCIYYAE